MITAGAASVPQVLINLKKVVKNIKVVIIKLYFN